MKWPTCFSPDGAPRARSRAARLMSAGVLALACVGVTVPAQAVVALFDWGFLIDGTLYARHMDVSYTGPGEDGSDVLPTTIDASGFDFSSGNIYPPDPGGLGTVRMVVDGSGAHSVGAYFDHELDEVTNLWFNELGMAVGTAATGQRWEIDMPALDIPPAYNGDIINNFFASGGPNLDDRVFYDALSGQTLGDVFPGAANGPEDVAMAMTWDFLLADGERAIIDFIVSDVQPNAGFYLQQSDPDSDISIYFYSTLSIVDAAAVPAPAALLMLVVGVVSVAASKRRVIRIKTGRTNSAQV